MIFEEKYFCCYILLPDQSSTSGCLHFVRYWAICVLFVNEVVTSKIKLFLLYDQNVIFKRLSLKQKKFFWKVSPTLVLETKFGDSPGLKDILP